MIEQNSPALEQALCNPHKQERGASLVEYSLLVALIAIIAIVAVRELGEATHNQFAEVATQLGGEKITKY
jgi:Flp pilus assembly pilin Flp